MAVIFQNMMAIGSLIKNTNTYLGDRIMKEKENYVIYKKGDIAECCGKLLTLNDLNPEEGHSFPNGTGKPWRSIYYRCPECNNVIVFDRGDGSPKELVNGRRVENKNS